jgi:hypothetical protein
MSDADRALQDALAEACFGDERAAEALAVDLPAFLERHGVAPDDLAAIAAQPPRLSVYRSLVRNGLSSVVLRMLPRTRARMNRADAGRFDRDFAAFVSRVGPRTHYVRDVPDEFFAWVEASWRSDAALPPYLADLAAFELASFAVAAAVDAPSALPLADVSLDRALVLHPSTRIARYGWRVHELAGALDACDEPARCDVALLAYRDTDHEVRWLELSPLAAAIVERIAAGASLSAAVTDACAAMSARFDPDAVAALLGELGARGVLLGARA